MIKLITKRARRFAIGAVAVLPASVVAQDTINVRPTQMVRGGVGLIQTPTARMQDEGTLSASYTDNDEYRFWTVNLQLFSWMEATARYTDVRTRFYSQSEEFSGDQTLKDKGLDVKFRLLEESYYLPDVSLGFRDIGGTGFFSSEFINASKAFGPFDVHLGIGWGYLGSHDDFTNPFCKLKDSFCERPGGFSGRGGKIDYQEYFKGPVAVFGGIEYQTPWAPLSIKVEYEGNNYENDRAGALAQRSRWNAGLVYRWNDFDFSLNYQRGNTVGFGVTYNFDMNQSQPHIMERPKRSLENREPPESVAKVKKGTLYRELYNESRVALTDAKIDEASATFYGTQLAYRDTEEGLERAGRVAASHLPDDIEQYNFIETNAGLPMVTNVIDAETFIGAARNEFLDKDIGDSITRRAPSEDELASYTPQGTQGFYTAVDTFWIQTFGSPEEFYMYQLGLVLTGGYSFNPNWTLSSSARVTLLDNFDFNFLTDNEETSVPRVRTRVREYVDQNRVALDTAFVNWKDQASKNWFVQGYGGYLETMFAGIGAEALYRPVDSNFAFGVDVNYVKQRDPASKTGLIDYEALTGFATVYWTPEALPDARISVSAGQFLAKDKGVNIDVAKRFDNGIIVGAFAAFTEISSEEYGEGSFTKGFYISIPSDLLFPWPTKGRGNLPWVPIGRDGGQQLQRPVKLIDITEPRSPFYD